MQVAAAQQPAPTWGGLGAYDSYCQGAGRRHSKGASLGGPPMPAAAPPPASRHLKHTCSKQADTTHECSSRTVGVLAGCARAPLPNPPASSLKPTLHATATSLPDWLTASLGSHRICISLTTGSEAQASRVSGRAKRKMSYLQCRGAVQGAVPPRYRWERGWAAAGPSGNGNKAAWRAWEAGPSQARPGRQAGRQGRKGQDRAHQTLPSACISTWKRSSPASWCPVSELSPTAKRLPASTEPGEAG